MRPAVNRAVLLPFGEVSPVGLLRSRAEVRPDAEALVWRPPDAERRAWSYAELVDDVARVAAGFARLGVGSGDFVCVHANNCPELVLSLFALNQLGAVVVTTNTRSSADELAYFLDKAGCVGIVTQVDLRSTATSAIAQLRRSLFVVDIGAAELPFDSLLTDDRQDVVMQSPWDVAGVQFTSGTTSRPKGVVWTNANYLWGAKLQAATEELNPEDRHLTHLPLFHTNAQIYSLMAAMWAGATTVLLPRFSARSFWPIALEERATWSSMIPFTVRALRGQPVPDHSFRAWGGGVQVPRWDQTFGVRTVSWWGMTETVGQGISSDPNAPVHPLAMGLPSSAYGVRVVDDDGVPLTGVGAGQLEIRGEPGLSLLLEYLGDPEATDAAFTDDGWFITGDRVEVHEDGWLSFLERDKDMLKVGGENVAALEVERVISRLRDVDEVAVVARRHQMLDEVPVAFITAVDGADRGALVDAVMAECAAQLADFKRPVAVHVVDALPRSTLEKIAKNVLRAWAADGVPGG